MDDYIRNMKRLQELYSNPAIIEAQQNAIRMNQLLGGTTGMIQTLQTARQSIEMVYPMGIAGCYESISSAMEQLVRPLGITDVGGFTASAEYLQMIVNSIPQVDTSMLYQVSRSVCSVEGLSILNLNIKEKDDLSDDSENEEEDNQANTEIIENIFQADDKSIVTPDSPVIHLSPINNDVLRYLAEDPKRFYELSGNDFEDVMTEIYRRLGYDVESTKRTRDGGKDIIIRRPEIMGDFIYYVECKRYAEDRKIGVGIVRNLHSTITTDNVNAGIIVTTSYFTKDARDFIQANKLGYKIKMQDFNQIKNCYIEWYKNAR